MFIQDSLMFTVRIVSEIMISKCPSSVLMYNSPFYKLEYILPKVGYLMEEMSYVSTFDFPTDMWIAHVENRI
jgi:hypothetical protein